MRRKKIGTPYDRSRATVASEKTAWAAMGLAKSSCLGQIFHHLLESTHTSESHRDNDHTPHGVDGRAGKLVDAPKELGVREPIVAAEGKDCACIGCKLA